MGQKGDFVTEAFELPTVSEIIHTRDLPKLDYLSYL